MYDTTLRRGFYKLQTSRDAFAQRRCRSSACAGVATSVEGVRWRIRTAMARAIPFPEKLAGHWRAPAGTMVIYPDGHVVSGPTDHSEAMARAGVGGVIEPSFWLGQPRTSLGSYVDYLSTILGFEKFRAGQFGIRHY